MFPRDKSVNDDEDGIHMKSVRKRSNETLPSNQEDCVKAKRFRPQPTNPAFLSDWLEWVKKAPIISNICKVMIRVKPKADFSDSDSEPEIVDERKKTWTLVENPKTTDIFSTVSPPLVRAPLRISGKGKDLPDGRWESLKDRKEFGFCDENKEPYGVNVQSKKKPHSKMTFEEDVFECKTLPKTHQNGHKSPKKIKSPSKKRISKKAFWISPVNKSKILTTINKSRSFTPNESINLEQKESYRLLLAQQHKNDGLNSAPSFLNRSKGNRIDKNKNFKTSDFFSKVNLTPNTKMDFLNRIKDKKTQALYSSPWDTKYNSAENILKPKSKKSMQSLPIKSSDDDDDDSPVVISELKHPKRNSAILRKNGNQSNSFMSQPSTSKKLSWDPIIISDEEVEEINNFQSVKKSSFVGRSRFNSMVSPLPTTRVKQENEKLFRRSYTFPSKAVGYCDKWLEELKQSVENDCKAQKKKVREQEEIKLALHDKREANILAANRKIFEDLRLTSLHISDKPDTEDDLLQFPEITNEMSKRIEESLRPTPHDEILSKGFGLQITRRDMETLAGLNWLNDEIINFYTNMLVERGKLDNYPSCFAFNTFFYPKLITHGHTALKRWTRKEDIFSYNLIIIPIHLGVHWCLAVIDFKQKKIQYYDSMGGHNNECLNSLRSYLQDESLDKRKKEYDLTDWKYEAVKNIPQQMNGCDCGMFALKYAEYITRNAKITFTQHHMPYFRRRMVYEIVTNKLL